VSGAPPSRGDRAKRRSDVGGPLSRKTPAQVRTDLAAFKERYKEDWRGWLLIFNQHPLTAPEAVNGCRAILVKWQAVRSRTKGRKVRLARPASMRGSRCLDDVLADALPSLKVLARVTVRDIPRLTAVQRAAMIELWNVFRDLPTIGHANAVGITKAVKLVTCGRIGPALDSEVRDHLGMPEPRDGAAWLKVLEVVARDIQAFEDANGCQLEELVEPRWQPVEVGRVYDMVFGPKAK
jgi:hypothetical protein